MRNQMQNWLSGVFGMDVIMRPTTLGGTLVDSRFHYWTVSGLLGEFILVTPKPGVRNPPVGEIARFIYDLRQFSSKWIAYGCLSLSAVERKRLLSRQVAFVVTGRQVFLPFLGIALRADSVALTRKWLGCVAQETVLAMLCGQLAHPFADRDIVRLTGCSRASAFRAFRELTTFGLVERVAGGYAFVSNAIQTLRLHMPRLRNSHTRDALVSAVFDE